MRSIASDVARSLSLFLLTGAAACATAGGPAGSQSRTTSKTAETLHYWRQIQDSVTAQAIADEQGPRVSIRAEFTSYADSRHVEAWFNVEDDAYVFVGHIDANGNVTVLFPEKPDDDGFVNGGRSYHTMPSFAGFESAYLWRRSNYYSRIATSRSRTDSYDYGTGYMFIVASWRPMRFDRVSENGRWSSLALADEEMLNDVRPAVGELASLLAGDNREAYSVEFAKYYRTNVSSGTYALSSYSALQCLYGYSAFRSFYLPVYGYDPFGYGAFAYDALGNAFFSPFGTPGSRCGNRGGYYGYSPFSRRYAYTPAPAPATPGGRLRPEPIVPPRVGRPDSLRPAGVSPKPAGMVEQPSLQPQPRFRASDDLLRPRDARPANGYRERGLITYDAGTGAQRPRISAEAQRPSIIDMVGRRREEMGALESRNGRVERYGQPRNRRESIDVPRGRSYSSPRRDGSSYPSAGGGAPRAGEARPMRPSGTQQPHERPTTRPSAGGGGVETRSAPSPSAAPRIESSSPRSSPRGEPGSRPQPVKPPHGN